jgi:hypothetical protein
MQLTRLGRQASQVTVLHKATRLWPQVTLQQATGQQCRSNCSAMIPAQTVCDQANLDDPQARILFRMERWDDVEDVCSNSE